MRLAAGLVGDVGTAEEIVQDAFAALLRRWRHLRDPASSYAYLQRVVVNGARGQWRRRNRFEVAIGRLSGNGEQATVLDVDSSMDMLAALARLPARKRACVVLRYYADLPESEVASLLQVSVGTVKSQTAKGLRQLGDVLNETRVR
jgi:RNA polymerase sigma-70 factor (sigma-E family)